jgi:transposase
VSQALPSIRTSPEELKDWLEGLIRQLRFAQLVAAVLALVTRLRDLNTELTKQLANLRRARPRSERMRALEAQLMLPFFAKAKPEASESEETSGRPDDEKNKKTRSKSKPSGRKPLSPELERVPAYNAVPAQMRLCPVCGLEMKQMGHTSCEYLDVIPAKVVVVHRIDEALKCPLDGTIVAAPAPARIVEKGVLGNRLIIEATADKFLEHQPIERQSRRFVRSGVVIAPQTLGRAVCAHLDLLKPLAEAIMEKTRGPGLLATDSTGVPVLDPSSPEGIRTGAMWAWTNALWVTFFYSPSGDSNSVRRFLGEDDDARATERSARDIQVDGTNILSFIERAGGTRPGCWAHARRGLVLCARSGDQIALAGVKLMAPLFEVERASKEAGENAEQRKARRLAESQPAVEAIRVWVDEQLALIPPKTSFGRALGYIKRQWRRLILFLDDGNIPLTNNRRERELRKLVLGRRNWLFVWQDVGGERTASILTILATCVSHGLNPRPYLHAVTEGLLRGERVETLLPDRLAVTRPDLCLPDFDQPTLPD